MNRHFVCRAGRSALALSGILSLALCALSAPGAAQAQTPASAKAAAPPSATPRLNIVTPPKPKLPSNVVATVNGTPILGADLLGIFEMVHGKPLVSELVKDQVIADRAKALGVTISEEELDAAIATTKDRIVQSQYGSGSPMTYQKFAEDQGISDTFLRWSVYEDTLRRKTYLKDAEKSIPSLTKQVKFAHILIATIPLTGAAPEKPASEADQAKTDADAKVKIDAILADIKAGKISFEDAARKNSDDKADASDGGVLPYAERGTFDPSFEAAAWSLKNVGDITDKPVKSKFGWHLIKLIARGSDAPEAEVKKYNAEQMERLNQTAQNTQAIGSWVNGLINQAKVVVNPSPVIVANPKSPMSMVRVTGGKKTASK